LTPGSLFWWWVFWISAAGVLATYLVYPAAVFLLSLLFGRDARANPARRPRVSVVLCARNEAERIAARIRNIFESDYPRDKLEVVLADDASEDGTIRAAQSAGCPVKIVRLDHHGGKSAALNAACRAADGEILVFADARQDFAPDTISLLVADLADEKVAAVSGSLIVPGGKGLGLYWKLEKLIRLHEGRLLSTIGATGAVYAIRKADFEEIEEDTILDDVVIPLKTVTAGRRSILNPRARAFDVAPEPGKEWRRKVRTLAGNYQLLLSPSRMGNPFRRRTFLQFLLHKVARLLVPLWLVGLLLSTAFISELWWLFWVQVGFYGLAGLGALAARFGFSLGPLGAPFEFVLLNGAAAAAFFHYVFGRSGARWKR